MQISDQKRVRRKTRKEFPHKEIIELMKVMGLDRCETGLKLPGIASLLILEFSARSRKWKWQERRNGILLFMAEKEMKNWKTLKVE